MTTKFAFLTGVLAACLGCPLAGHAQPTPRHWENVPFSHVPAQPLPDENCLPSFEEPARYFLVGTYAFSTGFTGQKVILQQDGAYSLSSYTDVMNGADLTNEQGKSFGVWSLRQDHAGQWVGVAAVSVVLTPTDATRKRRFLTAPLVLYPVRWQQRLYLLRAEDFVRFRDGIVAGYWDGRRQRFRSNFLLRDGDETKAVWGLPDFPLQWRSLLSDVRPVVALWPTLKPAPLVIERRPMSGSSDYTGSITVLAEMPWLLPKVRIDLPPTVPVNY